MKGRVVLHAQPIPDENDYRGTCPHLIVELSVKALLRVVWLLDTFHVCDSIVMRSYSHEIEGFLQ